MSDDELALLRGAAANPDDDLPRLVYADWLDDHDRHDQAAFVRLQVRRSGLDFFDPDRVNLLEEERISLHFYRRYWNGPVHRWLSANGLGGKVDARRGLIRGWDFHRGMIGRVNVRADRLKSVSHLVFALGPVANLRVDRWAWGRDEMKAVYPVLAQAKALTLQAGAGSLADAGTSSVLETGPIPLLELRELSHFVGSPRFHNWLVNQRRFEVVLFRTGGGLRVYDPSGKWPVLRLRFADLTGEILNPLSYQFAIR